MEPVSPLYLTLSELSVVTSALVEYLAVLKKRAREAEHYPTTRLLIEERTAEARKTLQEIRSQMDAQDRERASRTQTSWYTAGMGGISAILGRE